VLSHYSLLLKKIIPVRRAKKMLRRRVFCRQTTLARQFAQGDGEIARIAFETIGACIQILTFVARVGDRLQSDADLRRQAFGFRVRFLRGARALLLRRRGSGLFALVLDPVRVLGAHK